MAKKGKSPSAGITKSQEKNNVCISWGKMAILCLIILALYILTAPAFIFKIPKGAMDKSIFPDSERFKYSAGVMLAHGIIFVVLLYFIFMIYKMATALERFDGHEEFNNTEQFNLGVRSTQREAFDSYMGGLYSYKDTCVDKKKGTYSCKWKMDAPYGPFNLSSSPIGQVDRV